MGNRTRSFAGLLHIIAALLLIFLACSEESAQAPVDDVPVDQPDAPLVALIHPVGGELLVDTVTVLWEATDPDTGDAPLLAIDLEYRHGTRLTWSIAESGLSNDSRYLWDISSLEERHDYELRVTATDTSGLFNTDSTLAPFSIVRRILLTDRNGKDWDITHAVHRYGLLEENWVGGGGIDAIRPINDPLMLSPGEEGYPNDTSTELVVGFSMNGDTRAYPLRAMSGREVVNDEVGGVLISVIY
jgi:hypothetical protein